jgi:hypothetical protein
MNEKTKQAAPPATSVAVVKKTNGDAKVAVLAAAFGDVYIKVTKDGQIMRPIKAQITLFEKAGHFYGLSGKWNPDTKQTEKKYPIASQGYVHLNKVASISILTPPTVVRDGVAQPNPYVERNPKTRAIDSVIVRKIGIGYSPAGNIVAIDKTLYYNPYTYFIQSIQAKMGKVEWKTENGKRVKTDNLENPNAAVVGIAEEKPDRPGSWVFFPIELPLGLWVNYEDPAIIDCLEEHTQRQRFGDRIAQTIVERNILKDHPAIGVSNVIAGPGSVPEQGQRATVEVYGYRHDLNYADIKDILRQAAKGQGEVEVKAEVIDHVDITEERETINEVAVEDKVVSGEGLFDKAMEADLKKKEKF